MRKQKAEAVGQLVRQFLREEGLETPYNEYRLVEAWPEVMGPGVARHTADVQIRNRVLYVHLTSSVLRAELMAGRAMLVRRLNEYVGAQVIERIVLRQWQKKRMCGQAMTACMVRSWGSVGRSARSWKGQQRPMR